MYVVDSSVILKLLVQEDDSDKAAGFCASCMAGGIGLCAPDILLYEVGNILVRKRKLAIGAVTTAFEMILDTGVRLRIADVGFILRAAEIAGSTGASVYDASYVALAAEEGGVLVTADERLANLCGSAAHIRLLSSF